MTIIFCGIYSIKNKTNGNVYIGSSIDVYGRLRNHRSELVRGSHVNSLLLKEWRERGISNFCFSTILRLDKHTSKNDLLLFEKVVYDIYKQDFVMYNHHDIASQKIPNKKYELFKKIAEENMSEEVFTFPLIRTYYRYNGDRTVIYK